MRLKREDMLEPLRAEDLEPFIAEPILRIEDSLLGDAEGANDVYQTVVSSYCLQNLVDYRAAIQSWFHQLRVGGHLLILVPHAFLHERQAALPARWDRRQRRLYTPGSLLEEVEEALAPNSYRVRSLTDRDADYDYDADHLDVEPVCECDIALVIEKITLPAWSLASPRDESVIRGEAPDYQFEPPRTRVEITSRRAHSRILIMKLDHLGDFIMGMGALEKARAAFRDAHITLMVGSWNVDLARELGVSDEIVSFDAFPRNSTEDEPNVNATVRQFRQKFTADYDLAIDLRTDTDTRVLLKSVSAAIKAGIGTRSQFPFLDIFLPLDVNRNEPETAREDRLNHHAFGHQGSTVRTEHATRSFHNKVERDCAIIWGPYHRLRTGNYLFEPWFDLEENSHGGMLHLDIALDQMRVSELFITSKPPSLRMPFTVERPDARFEFRIWAVEEMPSIDFAFYGGRLIRQGAASVLHQSEYLSLLIELVVMRVAQVGMLEEVGR